jgi:hypothetical protein
MRPLQSFNRRVPLGGCDRYLLALEDLMMRSGQGRHVGVTVLQVSPGFSLSKLRNAIARFASSQSLVGASLVQGVPGSVPKWVLGSPGQIEITQHEQDADWAPIARDLLKGNWPGSMRFDVIPVAGGGATVLMSWSHLVLDARGIELALAELAHLASHSDASPELDSWALPPRGAKGLRQRLKAVRPFLNRYWELREKRVLSLAEPPRRPSGMEFRVLHFSSEQTQRMKKRADCITAGIFALPWFLAAAMRAHGEVLQARGQVEGALECTISVQTRKRGTRGPIFQNQVSQLFFALPLGALGSLEDAARQLQTQFAEMTRNRCDEAFLVMIDWMRRMPSVFYRRFLRREASGQVASFYHAHTGEFLPGVQEFCGGEIADGWHVPSVPQPPGTGLFFSERAGRLSMSLCWRGGTLSEAEQDLMLRSIRADLLGGGDF